MTTAHDIQTETDPGFITLQQAMARTQFSYSHLKGLVASGTLTGYRIPGGRSVRVKARDVDALLTKIQPRQGD
jgi:excisionase family DNA binding protein